MGSSPDASGGHIRPGPTDGRPAGTVSGEEIEASGSAGADIRAALTTLALDVADAAQLICVNDRTLRRWLAGARPPSRPAEHAINAWLRLHLAGLPWRPIARREQMTAAELRQSLQALHLHLIDLARVLRVTERTARRWAAAGEVVTPSAAEAIRAWLRLQAAGLSWRPDEQPVKIDLGDPELVERITRRVAERGGPMFPWRVDVVSGCASLGDIVLTYVSEPKAPFALRSIRPARDAADVERYAPLIEDAVFLILQRLYAGAREPAGRPARHAPPRQA